MPKHIIFLIYDHGSMYKFNLSIATCDYIYSVFITYKLYCFSVKNALICWGISEILFKRGFQTNTQKN